MLNFERELEKFKPILDIDHIEEYINQEEMVDFIDILKEFNISLDIKHRKKYATHFDEEE